jgi:hypothetical protein
VSAKSLSANIQLSYGSALKTLSTGTPAMLVRDHEKLWRTAKAIVATSGRNRRSSPQNHDLLNAA